MNKLTKKVKKNNKNKFKMQRNKSKNTKNIVKKVVNGGGGNNNANVNVNVNANANTNTNILTHENIKKNYYLCTETRYNKPINILRPFGELDEINKLFKKPIFSSDLQIIRDYKTESDKITNSKIVGVSQFGLYFRFVEKEVIDKNKFFENNSNGKEQRSFIFDIDNLIRYIYNNQNYIPLCWFAGFNAYGSTQNINTFILNKTEDGPEIDINNFLDNIGNILVPNIRDHEFVCRIPIPLEKYNGFLGKINIGILNIYEGLVLEEQQQRYLEEQQQRYLEEQLEEQQQRYLEEQLEEQQQRYKNTQTHNSISKTCRSKKTISECTNKKSMKICEWSQITNNCDIRKKPWK